MELTEMFTVFPADSWVDTLPNYQRKIVLALQSNCPSFEDAAAIWLETQLVNTYPFGATPPKSSYVSKLLDEIELLLKGDEKYANIYSAFKGPNAIAQTVITGMIASALAATLGVSTSFLAPAIVLVFKSIAIINARAWLAMREEKRSSAG